MKNLTAIIEKEEDWYVAICPEVDVASQGRTVDEAKENLKEAVELFFECASASEIARRTKTDLHVSPLEVAVG